MLRKIISTTLVILAFITVSCKKDNNSTPSTTGTVNFNVTYNFDGTSLQPDTILYTNAAGYKMSVTRLEYFISGITFIKADSSKTVLNDVHYLSFFDNATNQFSVSVPNGDYVALKLNIGLDTVHNKTGALPSTPNNINMEWPDMMGGGYHFIKMEGYYTDGTGTYGYTMHLGTNKHLVITLPIHKTCNVSSNTVSLNLGMNVAEWLKNPYRYDFNKDGNYTMNNDTAMSKIAANGVDVFN